VIFLLLSWIVLADAGFLHNKAAMLSVTIKERLVYITIIFFSPITDFSHPPPFSPVYFNSTPLFGIGHQLSG